MREIEVHHIFAIDSKLLVHTDMENFARRNVTRNQVAVSRIFLLQEIPRFTVFISPNSSSLSTSGFRHQPQLIISWNGSRMNLDKLTICVIDPLLIDRAGCRPRVDYRVRCFAKNNTWATRCQNNSIRSECHYFHRTKILCCNAATNAFIIKHCSQELPSLIFGNQTFRFITTNLFIKRIQQLLARCSTSKRSTMMFCSSETTEIKQSFRCAVEHNPHPVHQMNDPWSRLTHRLNRRLICQKVTAIHRIIKMLPRRIAFSFRINRTINSTLCTNGVGPLNRYQRE
ncbi:hypothetical protein D3C78_806620 [compost metagenome]